MIPCTKHSGRLHYLRKEAWDLSHKPSHLVLGERWAEGLAFRIRGPRACTPWIVPALVDRGHSIEALRTTLWLLRLPPLPPPLFPANLVPKAITEQTVKDLYTEVAHTCGALQHVICLPDGTLTTSAKRNVATLKQDMTRGTKAVDLRCDCEAGRRAVSPLARRSGDCRATSFSCGNALIRSAKCLYSWK